MTLDKRSAPYVFLIPVFLFGFVFFVVPLVFSLGLSFTRWNSLSPPRYVGTANYSFLLTRDPLFYQTLGNTAAFVAGTIALGVPLALLLGLAFRRSRLKPLWRSAFWLPMVTNIVAIAYVWRAVLDDPYGMVNRLLASLGIAGPAWLFDPSFAMLSIIIVFVWFQLGQDMMLISAGLDTVDERCEEAAKLDGASPLQVFWHVTLPLLRPTMLFVTMSNLVKGVGYFALMLVLTDGGPVNSTNVLALHTYQMAFFDLKLGMASAAAFILLVMVLAVAVLQLRMMRRGGLESYG